MSNSQFNEFEIIRELLPNIDDGVYVDVGAGDPIKFSNTYDLYNLGWYGLCIDLQSQFVNEHRQKRPRDICVCTALSNYVGTTEVFGGGHHCTIEKGYLKNTNVKVSLTTFDKVREQYEELCAKCLLCSIDVDYHEDKFFQGMNLSLFHPKLFIVESVKKYKDGADAEELWENKLFENDYKLIKISNIAINYFYIKAY